MLQNYGQYIVFDTEAEVFAANGNPGDIAYAGNTKLRYMCFGGTSWFPTDATRVIRGTSNVNLLSATAQKILTIPSTTYRFVVLGIHAETVTLTGSIVTQANLSAGATSPNYTDIAPAQGLVSGLLSAIGLGSTNALTLAASRAPLTGSTDIYVKVNLGAIGPSAYTARFDLFGYYEV